MTPVNSPPASAGTPPHMHSNDPESRIFQFPPPEHLQKSCRDDWSSLMPSDQFNSTESTTCGLPVSSSSPMAISPTNLSTLNTPRSSLASIPSRTSPMNTDNHDQPGLVEDLYLPYFDDDINFNADVQASFHASFGASYAMNFDQVSGGFPSPPGSGYSSPVPAATAYVDSMNDLPSVASYDIEIKPDLDSHVTSPYVGPLKYRTDIYAARSTPG